jgi:hypothetical protein
MAIARVLPSRNVDNAAVTAPSRSGPYLEAYTLPLGGGNLMFGDEGSFFTAVNATVGTGIAGHAAPVVADTDTKSLLHLYNGGAKNIIPVFLQLGFSAIGAGGTLSYNVIYTDSAAATAKSSGGTVITPTNVNTGVASTTGAIVTFGAVVTAPTSSRKVWAAQCREVIPVVNDVMTVFFGPDGGAMQTANIPSGTATASLVQYAPPIVIAPGGNLMFVRTRASQSGADSYTFTFGYLER